MRHVFVSRTYAGEFRGRLRWFSRFVLVAFGVLLGRLIQLQVMQRHMYTELAYNNIVRRFTLPATRGILYDQHGKVLASNRPCYNAYVIPGRVMTSARRSSLARKAIDTWPYIADLLQLTSSERSQCEARMRTACASDEEKSACWRSLLIRKDVSREVVMEARQYQTRFKGMDIFMTPIRIYPYKHLATHILGYVGELNIEMYQQVHPPGYDQASREERKKINPLDYELGDTLGIVGVERAWEPILRGQKGWEKRLIDARSRYRTEPNDQEFLRPPIRQEPRIGNQLQLTLDMELIQAVDRAMRDHRAGAVVIMEVHTGRILALYSKPHYDPNMLAGGRKHAQAEKMLTLLHTEQLSPMLDRTISGSFPPASTFKPFVALAALAENTFDPHRTTYCGGHVVVGKRVFRCTQAHGPVNLHQALAASCNVYFYKVGELIDIDQLAYMARMFGFGAKTGLNINPESPGIIPTRNWYALRYRGQFQVGFGLNMAIGQGDTTVTPLQLAAAYSALANGGTLFVPQVVRAITTSDGTIVQEFPPHIHRTLTIPAEHRKQVLVAMESVMRDPHGTAHKAHDKNLSLAAKTGTAQVTYTPAPNDTPEMIAYFKRSHAWFAAIFPAEAPEIALVVLLEHGGGGSAQAAPVGMQMIREYSRLRDARHASIP